MAGAEVARTSDRSAAGSWAGRPRSTPAWSSPARPPTTTSGETAGPTTTSSRISNGRRRDCALHRPRPTTQRPSRSRSSTPRRKQVSRCSYDPSDPAAPVGVAPSPRNVVSGTRWNAALAYLEDARRAPEPLDRGGEPRRSRPPRGLACSRSGDGRRPDRRGGDRRPHRRGLLLTGDPLPQRHRPVGRAPPPRDRRRPGPPRGRAIARPLRGGRRARALHRARGGDCRAGWRGWALRGARSRQGRELPLRSGQLGPPSASVDLPAARRRLPGQRDRVPHEAPVGGPASVALDRPRRPSRDRAWLPCSRRRSRRARRRDRARPLDQTRRTAGEPDRERAVPGRRGSGRLRSRERPKLLPSRRHVRDRPGGRPGLPGARHRGPARGRRLGHAHDPAGEHEPDDGRDRRARSRRRSDSRRGLHSGRAGRASI